MDGLIHCENLMSRAWSDRSHSGVDSSLLVPIIDYTEVHSHPLRISFCRDSNLLGIRCTNIHKEIYRDMILNIGFLNRIVGYSKIPSVRLTGLIKADGKITSPTYLEVQLTAMTDCRGPKLTMHCWANPVS
jgi:hypothetical protein